MLNTIEIDLNAINDNLRFFKNKIDSESKIIGVVKANAYGHGLAETARAVWTSGADILAVADIEEAVALRVEKIRAPIVVLGYVNPKDFRRAIDFDITLSAFELDDVLHLSQDAKKLNKWARIDMKVDTGMNRFGFSVHEAADIYQQIQGIEHIKLEGLHSHFAEPLDREFVKAQLMDFNNVLFALQKSSIKPPLVHMAATDASLLYDEAHFDAVRIGLGLYGFTEVSQFQTELKPVLSFKSKIGQIIRVGAGETIGYAKSFQAKKPMKIAVIPVGYADGYPRSLSNKSEVIINGFKTKVIGRVCMNVLMADVTGIKCANLDDVILIGSQDQNEIRADELGNLADTNTHEILSRLSATVAREYHFK